MMAATQPFLSGAISKTVNMPETATIADVEEIYYQGWKLGLKALAIYRDNCKGGQPRADDGGHAAVPVRRDLQDGQHAGDGHDRRRRGDLLPGLEARPEGARDLPRQ